MSLVVSEVDFAVLTVLISVWVNDSAPSLGTHWRGGWMRGRERAREKDGICKIKNDSNITHSVYTLFRLFGFNFQLHSTYPHPPIPFISHLLFSQHI